MKIGRFFFDTATVGLFLSVVAGQIGYRPNLLISYSTTGQKLYRLCRIKNSASEAPRFGGAFHIMQYRTENSDMTVGLVTINSGSSMDSVSRFTTLLGDRDGFLYRDANYLYAYLKDPYYYIAISYIMIKEGELRPTLVENISLDSLIKCI